MNEELERRIAQLDMQIEALKAAGGLDSSLIANISALFSISDSIVEFARPSPNTLSKYNRLKLEYGSLFDGKGAYYSADRNARISRISEEAAHLLNSQKLLRQYALSQAEAVDALAEHMERGGMALEGAVEELGTFRKITRRKMKIWRVVAVGVTFLAVFTVLLLLKSII